MTDQPLYRHQVKASQNITLHNLLLPKCHQLFLGNEWFKCEDRQSTANSDEDHRRSNHRIKISIRGYLLRKLLKVSFFLEVKQISIKACLFGLWRMRKLSSSSRSRQDRRYLVAHRSQNLETATKALSVSEVDFPHSPGDIPRALHHVLCCYAISQNVLSFNTPTIQQHRTDCSRSALQESF